MQSEGIKRAFKDVETLGAKYHVSIEITFLLPADDRLPKMLRGNAKKWNR